MLQACHISKFASFFVHAAASLIIFFVIGLFARQSYYLDTKILSFLQVSTLAFQMDHAVGEKTHGWKTI